jgi:mannose-6-phosphate isomerase-like protein (cupin superfamily)
MPRARKIHPQDQGAKVIAKRGKSAFIATVAVLILASNVASGQSGASASAAKSSQPDSTAGSKLPVVAYFSKAEVDANFEHPKAMDDTIYAPDYGSHNFKVKTSKRTKTIAAEVHTQWTDVIYVVKGSATLVTGGQLKDDITPRTFPDGTPFNESKMARSIVGGHSRRVSLGDVIVVPNNVPHWFKDIDGPFWFFNVKTR